MVDKSKFTEWLQEEMDSRGMSQASLARNAGVTRAAINGVLTEVRGIGTELCTAIAGAFGYPPDYVFRKAGLLPDLEEEELPGLDDLTNAYRLASDDERREIVEFAKFKIRR